MILFIYFQMPPSSGTILQLNPTTTINLLIDATLEAPSLGACLFLLFFSFFVRERSRNEACTIIIRLYTSKFTFDSSTIRQYNDSTLLELLDFGGVSHGTYLVLTCFEPSRLPRS
jgi:hypothetical protein